MRLFSRFMMVAGLLGGLAFGSYAFGKYVLSNRLFGPQGAARQHHGSESDGEHFGSTVSRSSAIKGSPRAEIDVLPSDEAGDAPEPDLSTARQHTERRPVDDSTAKKTADTPQYDADGNPVVLPTPTPTVDVSIDPDDNPDATPVPRKRRHKKHLVHQTKSTDTESPAKSGDNNTDSLPARAVNDGTAPHDSDSAPKSREDSPSTDMAPPVPVERPDSGSHDDGDTTPAPKVHRHHRERIKSDSVTEATPDRVPKRHVPTRRHEDSPVPRPEGDSGGDSPVPLPG